VSGCKPLLIKGSSKLTGTRTCINLLPAPKGTHSDL